MTDTRKSQTILWALFLPFLSFRHFIFTLPNIAHTLLTNYVSEKHLRTYRGN